MDQEIEWSKAGGNLIMHSSDFALFGQGLKRELNELREALDDADSADRWGETTPIV